MIISGLIRVIIDKREKLFKFYEYLTGLLKIICENSKWLAPANRINIRLPDVNDDMYLRLTLAADAKYLITGNARHFPDRAIRWDINNISR